MSAWKTIHRLRTDLQTLIRQNEDLRKTLPALFTRVQCARDKSVRIRAAIAKYRLLAETLPPF